MSNVANAALNSLASHVMKSDFVPPSEQLVTLTYGQLQNLITGAIEKAVQPLQDRIESLEATVAALDTTEEQDVNRISLDIAHDRRRITALEYPTKTPGKTEVSRAEKIEKYLATMPYHRATFETIRGHLGINKDLLNDAIKTLMAAYPDRYGIVPTPGDKRKRTLIVIPK